MTEKMTTSIYKGVELFCEANNKEHHTDEISVDQLIVRRGQPFKLTVTLTQSVNLDLHPIALTAMIGKHPSEEWGTISYFSFPDHVKRSPSAKAVWKVEVDSSSSLKTSILKLIITPAADTPIGEYILVMTHRDEELLLALPVVLFNAWCPDDWVFLSDEEERQEYVMNEQGIIYRGSANYISPLDWDFGQFEDNMVTICMKLLDHNHKHLADPADDVSARCNPIYVGRVVSAMINSEDDCGVLEGRWGGSYSEGRSPSHWTGSYAILKQWLKSDCHPVKYGQCWVFAGVMCAVMRLLGIPSRVVTNFASAHDNNANLTIDVYHSEEGAKEKPTHDSVWNFHVWVEAWMRRPDLDKDGKFDGWQVLDPTPQELSDGVYCCGPAPVKAILNGETQLKYDIPFVFAEVNADCVDWLVKVDGSLVKLYSDTSRVGQNMSTKSVGSDKRLNITNNYKHKEGSDKERSVFIYACTRDYSRGDEDKEMEEAADNAEMEEAADNAEMEEAADNVVTAENETNEVTLDEETSDSIPPLPPLTLEFKEVSEPVNGKDVSLELVLHSKSSVAMPLSINISVQAMKYNSTSAVNIQSEKKKETLQPEKDLCIPILVPFSVYKKDMLESDSMKVSAIVMDEENTDKSYLAENDVVLLDPPISVTVIGQARLNQESFGEIVFMNPVDEVLTGCTLTLSGSGLFKDELEFQLEDLEPNNRMIIRFAFTPYKTRQKILAVDFNCSIFRDIKGRCPVNVEP